MAIYSEFSHKKWWFSIAMLVYQRVFYVTSCNWGPAVPTEIWLSQLRPGSWKLQCGKSTEIQNPFRSKKCASAFKQIQKTPNYPDTSNIFQISQVIYQVPMGGSPGATEVPEHLGAQRAQLLAKAPEEARDQWKREMLIRKNAGFLLGKTMYKSMKHFLGANHQFFSLMELLYGDILGI